MKGLKTNQTGTLVQNILVLATMIEIHATMILTHLLNLTKLLVIKIIAKHTALKIIQFSILGKCVVLRIFYFSNAV